MILVKPKRCDQVESLDRRRPRAFTQSGPHLVVLGLGAGRPSDRGVGKVHVRGHRARIRGSTRVRVRRVVIRGSRRRDTPVRGGCPAQTGHVRASTDAVGPVVVVRRRLQRLRRSVGTRMRGHGRSRVRVTVGGQRRRCSRGGGSRAGLNKVAANMGRNRSVPHVILLTRHVQRGKLATRGDGMMSRRRSGMDRVGVGEHAIPRQPPPLLVLSQVGFGLCGGFFDSTRVVILMPCQGCATREGLLAIRVRAFVRSLARVDPAVSSQGRRITEGLDGSVR